MKPTCFFIALLLPFANAGFAVQGNVMLLVESVSGFSAYSCYQLCSVTTYAGAGACKPNVAIDSSYLNTMKNFGPITYSTNGGSGIPYYNMASPFFVTGITSCASTAVQQICACEYTVVNPITPVLISSSITNYTSNAANTYGTTASGYMQFYTGNTPKAPYALDTTRFNGFSSAAMDANNNIYYTVTGNVVQSTAAGDAIYAPQSAPFLYVLYYPYTGQPQYTGISTCAYVFDNRVNVFCLGSAGLIRVV